MRVAGRPAKASRRLKLGERVEAEVPPPRRGARPRGGRSPRDLRGRPRARGGQARGHGHPSRRGPRYGHAGRRRPRACAGHCGRRRPAPPGHRASLSTRAPPASSCWPRPRPRTMRSPPSSRRTVSRRYLCLVHGRIQRDAGSDRRAHRPRPALARAHGGRDGWKGPAIDHALPGAGALAGRELCRVPARDRAHATRSACTWPRWGTRSWATTPTVAAARAGAGEPGASGAARGAGRGGAPCRRAGLRSSRQRRAGGVRGSAAPPYHPPAGRLREAPRAELVSPPAQICTRVSHRRTSAAAGDP